MIFMDCVGIPHFACVRRAIFMCQSIYQPPIISQQTVLPAEFSLHLLLVSQHFSFFSGWFVILLSESSVGALAHHADV
jgi:hypothetical protein